MPSGRHTARQQLLAVLKAQWVQQGGEGGSQWAQQGGEGGLRGGGEGETARRLKLRMNGEGGAYNPKL